MMYGMNANEGIAIAIDADPILSATMLYSGPI